MTTAFVVAAMSLVGTAGAARPTQGPSYPDAAADPAAPGEVPEVGAVSGSVTAGVDGSPAVGVCVSARGVDEGSGAGVEPRVTVTDASGDYTLGGLVSGEYAVSFDVCGAGLEDGVGAVVVPPGRTVTVSAPATTDGVDARLVGPSDTNVDMPAGAAAPGDVREVGAVSGSVTAGVDGPPAVGVCVSARGVDEGSGAGVEPRVTVTDASGDYTLGGLVSGEYAVSFDVCGAGLEDGVGAVVVPPGRTVTVSAPATTDGVDARLVGPSDADVDLPAGAAAPGDVREVGAVSGSVTAGVDGSPAVGVCVSARGVDDGSGAGVEPRVTVTDASGAYTLGGLVSGEYSVSFDVCGAGLEDGVGAVVVPPGRTVTVSAPATTDGVDARLVEPSDTDVSADLSAPQTNPEAGDGHITGTVTADVGGGPLEGICVSAYDPDTDAYGSGGTGPNGSYDIGGLPTGSYTVYFSDCGGGTYAREWFDDAASSSSATRVAVTVGQTTSGIDAGLAVGGHITGTVTADVGGGPLEGICVTAYDPDTDAYGSGGTGPDGSYDIGGLPTGSYTVYFYDCGDGTYLREWFDDAASSSAATPVAVTVGQTTSGIDAGLADGGHITGTVTADVGGGPLEDICVYAEDPDTDDYWYGQTGPDGSYDIGGLPTGSYTVYFYDCSDGTYLGEWFDDAASSSSATPVGVTVGQTTSGIDAGLAVGGHITGTVTADVGGGPLEGICVYAEDTGAYGYGQTGPDGSYDIGGLPTGSYTVYFSDCGGGTYLREWFDDAASSSSATRVAVTAGQTTSGIDAGLAVGGHITGTVTADVGGGPLEGICVTAYDPDTGYWYGETGPNGSYDIGGLPTGSYTVYFSDCGGGTYAREWFDDAASSSSATRVAVTVGQTTSGIDAGLAVGGHITGTVTADVGGGPLEYICVTAYDPDTDDYGYGRTGPDGSYDIGGLPTGSYTVYFYDCGDGTYLREWFDDAASSSAATPVAVTVGQTTSGIDAGLTPPGHITGTVTADVGGGPLEGICVTAYDPDTDAYGYGETGPDGSYDIGGLPTGSYTVQFYDCGDGTYAREWFDDAASWSSATRVAVTVGQTTSGIDAGLTPPGHITGTVTADVGGGPLEDICLYVYDPDTDAYGYGETGPDGTYDIGGLPTGSYVVRFSDCGDGTYLREWFDDASSWSAATPVGVTVGQTNSGIDAGLALAGHITGTVTADVGGGPLEDICVSAEDPDTYAYGYGETGPDGTYDIGGLPTGSYVVRFSDCGDGTYAREWFDDASSWSSATPVGVTVGETTSGIDAGLAVGGHITGTVTADVGGGTLADICVDAEDPDTYAYGYGETGSDGTYDIGGLPTGSYTVRFYDCGGGTYAREWFDDASSWSSATPVGVTVGETTSGIDAGLAVGGHITGTVTADVGGGTLADICVDAEDPDTYAYGYGETGSDGTYDIGGLPTGSYTVRFYDCGDGTYLGEWFDDAASSSSATPVAVTAGETTSGIDAGLAFGGYIAGTVTETGSGEPVAGAFVAVLDTADFSVVAGAVADASGDYFVAITPGSYFVYVIDTTGDHVNGFHGPPATVVVTAGNTTDADPTLRTTRGSVTSTVTDALTGDPLEGVWGLALSASTANTGATERIVDSDASGQLAISGLAAGPHFIGFADPTGAHASRFHPDSPNVPDSTPVAVTAGDSTAANVSLPAQTPVPGGATISGTVTEAGTGDPVPSARVVALRASDYAMARGAVADASGHYSLDLEPEGEYKLAIVDGAGLHAMEWHDDQPSTGLADAATVVAPATVNAALPATTGTMAGTITDETSGDPVEGVWVIAIGASGIAGGAVTAVDGTYTIDGLAPGTYRATFADPNGGRPQEYFDNSPNYDGATPFAVTAGATATIDAALALP